jgi:hypothetical protein
MPFNDMQIHCTKPKDKAYTLGDGQGLSLLIEPNGSKAGGSAIAMSVSPK